jgi:glycosyltransferase involved in cell wall biosynthesis
MKTKNHSLNSTKEKCLFSIIVPTCGRQQMLHRLLDSLRDHLSHVPVELILIDDSSGDSLTSIRSRKDFRFPILYASTPNKGPANARNTGIDLSTGTYLVFTDDDCIVTSDWLPHMHAEIQEGYEAVGSSSAATGYSIVERYYDLLDLFKPGHGPDGSIVYLLSNNLIIPRKTINQVGKFNSLFTRPGGEDSELCYRVRKSGGRLGYAEKARIYHDFTPSVKSFIQRYYNYGVGHRTIFEIHTSSEHYLIDPIGNWKYLTGTTPTVHSIEPMDMTKPLFSILSYIKEISFLAGYLGYYESPPHLNTFNRNEALTSFLLDSMESESDIRQVQEEIIDRFPETKNLFNPSCITKKSWWTELARCFDLKQIFRIIRESGPQPKILRGPPIIDESTKQHLQTIAFEQVQATNKRCTSVLRKFVNMKELPNSLQAQAICENADLDWTYFERWMAWFHTQKNLFDSLAIGTDAEISKMARALFPHFS